MPGRRFRLLCIASALCSAIVLGAQIAPAATPGANDPWPGLVQDIFNNRPMNDGAEVIGIEMPYRAEDAAIVPVTLRTRLSPGDNRRVLRITLVIDQNPAPMAAKFCTERFQTRPTRQLDRRQRFTGLRHPYT